MSDLVSNLLRSAYLFSPTSIKRRTPQPNQILTAPRHHRRLNPRASHLLFPRLLRRAQILYTRGREAIPQGLGLADDRDALENPAVFEIVVVLLGENRFLTCIALLN